MDRREKNLVIFDCDGVLVDSEVISVKVDQLVLADLGWSISVEEIIERFVGRSHAHFLEVVEEHIGRKLPDDWEDAYQHLYRQALDRDLRLIDGIADALDKIDLPMCVASNGSQSKMEFTLKRVNLWSRFEPADCIVVEDSWTGVTAALAAQMKVIAYTGGITSLHQIPAGEATMIDHMSQLPGAILELIGN